MKRILSFAPIVDREPFLLILGSIPSVASLEKQHYYANPRNVFWKIMAKIIGFENELAYEKKITHLMNAKVALWDVLHSCQRKGSLDSQIKYEKPNDIKNFVKDKSIEAIFLNGSKAAASFYRHIPIENFSHIKIFPLPSTSPANARMREQEKYQQWKEAWQLSKK